MMPALVTADMPHRFSFVEAWLLYMVVDQCAPIPTRTNTFSLSPPKITLETTQKGMEDISNDFVVPKDVRVPVNREVPIVTPRVHRSLVGISSQEAA